MNLIEEIKKDLSTVGALINGNKGVYSIEIMLAERKSFLSRKKLLYTASFRIDDSKKEIRYTEKLKETGFGLSSGSDSLDTSPGFGFKKETYKTGIGPREGTIEEQSNLFGKQYNYKFDFGSIRKIAETRAKQAGYTFSYHLTSKNV